MSRTLQIKTEDREHFLETLQAALRRATVNAFTVQFSGLKWVPNFERNRWFLVLSIKKPPKDELNRILDACNKAAKTCGHHELYTGSHGDGIQQEKAQDVSSRNSGTGDKDVIDHSAYFHISIAWNLAEPRIDWIDMIQEIDANDHLRSLKIQFDAVKARIGNNVHSVALKPDRSGSGKGSMLGLT